jgi:hypothetical protein
VLKLLSFLGLGIKVTRQCPQKKEIQCIPPWPQQERYGEGGMSNNFQVTNQNLDLLIPSYSGASFLISSRYKKGDEKDDRQPN